MGCFESKNSPMTFSEYSEKLISALDLEALDTIKALLFSAKYQFKSETPAIDQEIACINNIRLNALSYSLFLGSLSLFKFLLNAGASLKSMDDLLEKSNIRAINVICYKGYLDMLEYYIGLFLAKYRHSRAPHKSFTIDLKDSFTARYEYDLPIHSACRAGNLNIVSYLFQYFKDKYCPKEFNIFSLDESFGEDCSLIACRSGSFSLVKYLHETCKMKFDLINAYNENAVQITIASHNKNNSHSYLEILEYLVLVVRIDILKNYEELLFLAEGPEAIIFLENELAKKGCLKKKEAPLCKKSKGEDDSSAAVGMFFNDEALKKLSVTVGSNLSRIPSDMYDRRFSSFLSCKLDL